MATFRDGLALFIGIVVLATLCFGIAGAKPRPAEMDRTSITVAGSTPVLAIAGSIAEIFQTRMSKYSSPVKVIRMRIQIFHSQNSAFPFGVKNPVLLPFISSSDESVAFKKIPQHFHGLMN